MTMTENRCVALGPVLPKELGERLTGAITRGEGAALRDQLEGLIGCAIDGLVVYGSALVSLSSASDIDLLILSAELVQGGLWGDSGDVLVDAHLHPRRRCLEAPVDHWSHLYGGRVLYDDAPPALETWLESIARWRLATPDPWRCDERLRDRVWALRSIARIARLNATDPLRATLHEAELLAAVPTLYAQARGMHPGSIGSWWASPPDPRLIQALDAVRRRRGVTPSPALLRAVIEQVYDAEGAP
ncbi:hypothetical protein ACUN9Y_18615 [Halomonas sp. V046]|uniref:hypothetical protein n=1 Tax=Halomonas sp. V046 TaxID=3459611 RepID=UPI004044C0F6